MRGGVADHCLVHEGVGPVRPAVRDRAGSTGTLPGMRANATPEILLR